MKIIVPYRDRPNHLARFITHMKDYLPAADIVVVEQCDEKPFNRGKLLNIGFEKAAADEFYCFHDVDMLPVTVDYTCDWKHEVTQLALSSIQKRDYLGGVTLFTSDAFVTANGYPNDFERGEDNCMMFTLHRQGVRVHYRPGKFEYLVHSRPTLEFDPEVYRRAQMKRKLSNGLVGLQYEASVIQLDNYLLIKAWT